LATRAWERRATVQSSIDVGSLAPEVARPDVARPEWALRRDASLLAKVLHATAYAKVTSSVHAAQPASQALTRRLAAGSASQLLPGSE